MFTNRISKIAIVTVVIVITLLMASFAASPKPGQSYPDYAQRHHSEISAGRPVDTTERVFLKSLLPSFLYTDFTETTERSLFITVFSAKLSEIRGVRVPKSL